MVSADEGVQQAYSVDSSRIVVRGSAAQPTQTTAVPFGKGTVYGIPDCRKTACARAHLWSFGPDVNRTQLFCAQRQRYKSRHRFSRREKVGVGGSRPYLLSFGYHIPMSCGCYTTWCRGVRLRRVVS